MPSVAIIFGWPAIIGSLLLNIAGLSSSRPRLVLIAAAAGSPFLLYLSLTPRFRLIAPLVALSYYVAPYALARGRRAIAFLLTIPFIGLALFVATLVWGPLWGIVSLMFLEVP